MNTNFMERMQVACTGDGISGTVLSADFVTAENRWSLAMGCRLRLDLRSA